MTPVHAFRDPRLSARVLARRPLTYATGVDATSDRPAHVRAASAVQWLEGRLAVIQDDASFVALTDPATGLGDALAWPAGPDGRRQFDSSRGNKRLKLDLEACTPVPGRGLLAVGSGSSPRREWLGWVRADGVELLPAPALYAALRDCVEFSGSELNVEGAALVGKDLWLFNRGNGAPKPPLAPVDAICRLPWAAVEAYLAGGPVPIPERVRQYALGEIGGCRLGFTDAAWIGGRVFYLAAAEASPDAIDDGEVAGSALGVLGENGAARWIELTDADGRPLAIKAEGLCAGPAPDRLYLVLDADDPARPAELCEVALAGDWC